MSRSQGSREDGSTATATARAAAVGLGLLLTLATAACGQPTGYGQIIGVRPAPSVAPDDSNLDTSSLVDTLDEQLQQADDARPIVGENALAYGELPIDTFLTLKESEQLAYLQQLGQSVISARVAAIATVRNQLMAVPNVPNGSRYRILYLLNSATASLNAMQVKIASDQLVDVARADVRAVATFRVYGLLLPQCHMLIAAVTSQSFVAVINSQIGGFNAQFQKLSAALIPVPPAAVAAVQDMYRQAQYISYWSARTVDLLLYLTAAGYPGNRSQIAEARGWLNALRLSTDQAARDYQTAKAALGL